MKFTRLRLSGFKSFVEPTDFLIEPGLTGVVGPNGCGKSNLLEALRWVMGESSYKSMRGAGMDDVIFSGTTARPSRNMAEVMVTMSNDDRTAPPQHNDSEVLEISRRIEREAGSAYRINGKDVRARDVQLLFADVSTGARSPALVRQGQIAEIINAKPQARRLILEEAAGITGLHTRRHEAELKLKGAEANLTRLEDVTSQLETQLNSLKRQARQAQKYKLVSAEIRRLEAAGLYVAWKDAADAAEKDQAGLDEATRVLAEHIRAASEKLRARDELGEKLPALREQETIRAAVLQRVGLERNNLDEEERRVEARHKELGQLLAQASADLTRERDTLGDTDGVIARLVEEDTALKAALGKDGELRAAAALALQSAASALAEAQEAADQAGARLSELNARRGALSRSIEEQKQRVARLERDEAETNGKRQQLLAQMGNAGDGPTLAAAVETAVNVVASNETAANEAEVALRFARMVETETRQAHDEARRKADRLQTEVRTLTNFLKASSDALWPSLVDQIRVERGFEAALGAALGDDMDASSDEGAPTHWRGLPPLDSPLMLPRDAQPLSNFVQAPQALTRRLSHIGVISKSLGPVLQAQLRPGQRLVSREGDVWRWDGYTSAADAPSAAAKRLAERNRLTLLEIEMQAKAAGLDVVYKEAYATGTKDFAAMIEAVKARNPDVLIASGYTGDMIVLARQTAEQKLPLKMFGMTLGPTLPGFVESLGASAENLLEPVQWTSDLPWKDEIFGWTAADYAALCQKTYNHVCDYHPPQSTAALQVYQRAIEKAGSLDPQKVRDALAQTNMMTAYGPIRFNDLGQNIAKGMSVVQIQQGKPVVVYPIEGAKAKFVYPMPR